MHCHVLPGVDDGPAAIEESMAVLKEAARQGIGAMIVTPHFHPGRYRVDASRILETLNQMRGAIAREGLKIRLVPGQECYYYSGLLEELEAGNALTMAGTNYVLVEFDGDTLYSKIQLAVRELGENGYRPIIAHYERYSCLHKRTDRLDELRARGAMLQMNFDRLLDRDSLFHPNQWRRLLKEGYVDFLGSDTHGMKFRPLHVKQAVAWMTAEVKPELRKKILTDNIRLLLGQNANAAARPGRFRRGNTEIGG
ncbi:MAG: hypothetical protein IJ769_06950 [Clostridia bacterium]|nr:hypothetical protein [Clostridia bacterium]